MNIFTLNPPPFELCGHYVYDSKGEVFADFNLDACHETPLRCAQHAIVDAITAYWSEEKPTPATSNTGAEYAYSGGVVGSETAPVLRVRGWGRLQYLKDCDPGQVQDDIGTAIAQALTKYLKKRS